MFSSILPDPSECKAAVTLKLIEGDFGVHFVVYGLALRVDDALYS